MSTEINDKFKIDELSQWFQECLDVPNRIDPLLLKRFYYTMHCDIEETKKLIILHYKLRSKSSHIFIIRDPNDDDTRRTFEYTDMVQLPGLTPENYKVFCIRLCDYDPNKVHHAEDTKTFFMLLDCRFITHDCDEDPKKLSIGEVYIFDMAGFTLKHLSKLSLFELRSYIRFMQDALPVRLHAIHVIHCPSYLSKILAVVKPFISSMVFELIHFHTEDIQQLFEYVPCKMLPEEYGGAAGKFYDLKQESEKRLELKRSYLMDSDYWTIKQH